MTAKRSRASTRVDASLLASVHLLPPRSWPCLSSDRQAAVPLSLPVPVEPRQLPPASLLELLSPIPSSDSVPSLSPLRPSFCRKPHIVGCAHSRATRRHPHRAKRVGDGALTSLLRLLVSLGFRTASLSSPPTTRQRMAAAVPSSAPFGIVHAPATACSCALLHGAQQLHCR